jgi:hypothetical protein
MALPFSRAAAPSEGFFAGGAAWGFQSRLRAVPSRRWRSQDPLSAPLRTPSATRGTRMSAGTASPCRTASVPLACTTLRNVPCRAFDRPIVPRRAEPVQYRPLPSRQPPLLTLLWSLLPPFELGAYPLMTCGVAALCDCMRSQPVMALLQPRGELVEPRVWSLPPSFDRLRTRVVREAGRR